MNSHVHPGPPSRARANSTLYVVLLGICAIFLSYQALQALAPRVIAPALTGPHATQQSTFSIDCSKLPALAAESAWKNVSVIENGKVQFTMSVYNASDIVSDHISRGTWEEAEIRQVEWALARYPGPFNATTLKPVFVDIGANIGWFTLIMALRSYTVYAFEGMAQNARMVASSLCANPALQSRVSLFNVGLGPAPDRCWIFSGDINVGDGHTMCGIPSIEDARARIPSDYKLRGDMNISRLDDVLLPRLLPTPTSPPPPPLVLKIDVEGFEYEVMRGATQLLSRGFFHYILTEWSDSMMGGKSGKHAPRDFLYLMAGLGFAISPTGFAGPFVPIERLSDLAVHWKAGEKNLYLVHRQAPTYKDVRIMTPLEAGLPAPAAPVLGAGGPPVVSQAVQKGMAQLQQPTVEKGQAGAAAAAATPAQGEAWQAENGGKAATGAVPPKARRLLQQRV